MAECRGKPNRFGQLVIATTTLDIRQLTFDIRDNLEFIHTFEVAGEGSNRPSSGPSGHLLPKGEGLVGFCPN